MRVFNVNIMDETGNHPFIVDAEDAKQAFIKVLSLSTSSQIAMISQISCTEMNGVQIIQ